MSSNRDDGDEEETILFAFFESDFVTLLVLFFFFHEFKVDLIGSLSFSSSFPSLPSSCLETQHPILCALSYILSLCALKRTDLKRLKGGDFYEGNCLFCVGTH